MLNSKPTTIHYARLTLDDQYRHREGPESPTHLAMLQRTLRNTGKLDPVLVWEEVDSDDNPTGRLVLLDGYYRLAAYRAEHRVGRNQGLVPASLFKGNRSEASLAGLAVNAKDTLPLTTRERANAAWKLVIKFRLSISKSRLAKASGISQRTIANMRKKLKEFDQAAEVPNGSWHKDKDWPAAHEFSLPSDEEREQIVCSLSQGICAALREARTKDVEIRADALERALGRRELSLIVDYLSGGAWAVGQLMDEDEFEQDF